ncbi:MAG: HAD hydrolase family protein [Rhodospirillales bacterium]|nr:HAD hydrolase family protein [Rhodospirillales bacterium]
MPETVRDIQPTLDDIDLLIMDFDGVLTDNRILVSEDGIEHVFCSRADGLGIDMLRAANLAMVIVSTETNKVVAARARKLDIPVHFGVRDKSETTIAVCREFNCSLERAAFIGNDINDLPGMELVGWPICPVDAHPKVKEICKFVVACDGGYGVVRHLADALLG